jgi:hypothetical protein
MKTSASWPSAGPVVALMICSALVACGDDSHHDDGAVDEGASHHGGDSSTDEGGDSSTDEGGGMATGATCPSDNAPTYETFGEGFMASYCTRCHSSELEGDARNGAPLDHDFDSLVGVVSVAEHIDQYAAAGPDALNTEMPPNGDTPSQEEREMLGQWLACELEAAQ